MSSMRNKFKDLALLRIDGFDLPVVKLGTSNKVGSSEKVVAIGSLFISELYGFITDGILSKVREMDGTKYF